MINLSFREFKIFLHANMFSEFRNIRILTEGIKLHLKADL